jgi:uncharacterized membrane protein
MYKIMLALHLLAVVFAVGPLVGAASTAVRGLRTGDAAATSTSARLVTIYSYASVVAVIFGMGLMSANDPDHPGHKVADIGDVWILVSLSLWLFAIVEGLALLVPALKQAAAGLEAGNPVDAFRGKVAMLGGSIALNYAVIVFLMVYQPGS